MFGWCISRKLNIDALKNDNDLGMYYEIDEYFAFEHTKKKFKNDVQFVCFQDELRILDGFILNKQELMDEYGEQDWKILYKMLTEQENFPQMLRGCFNGATYKKDEDRLEVFTNQVGDRPVYYYIEGETFLISSNYNYILRVLKANGITLSADENAVNYMLTYGYMIDATTFCKQVKRLLPGQLLSIEQGNQNNAIIKQYYKLTNRNPRDISEEEAIELIDKAFRKGIKREFEKDKEYGYEHLVDLSGGMDSRMTSWVAHEMGYVDQLNISYCKSGYYDEKIAKKIAEYLNHEFLFKFLDDKKFVYDIERLTEENFAASPYIGITGGERLLRALNMDIFGLEHTGQLGDVILSTFFATQEEIFSKPVFGDKMYSNYLKCDFDKSILEQHENREIFAMYARGFLGTCSTHLIRQNYTEVVSPFLDVDFMEACFSLPFHMRKGHYIYLKWIEKNIRKHLNSNGKQQEQL